MLSVLIREVEKRRVLELAADKDTLHIAGLEAELATLREQLAAAEHDHDECTDPRVLATALAEGARLRGALDAYVAEYGCPYCGDTGTSDTHLSECPLRAALSATPTAGAVLEALGYVQLGVNLLANAAHDGYVTDPRIRDMIEALTESTNVPALRGLLGRE